MSSTQSESATIGAFFARQPIFDERGRARAYELLYRASPDAVAASGDPDHMAARVVVDAMLGSGLENVTDGRPAFVNATADLIISGVFESVDPSRIVIEILETVEPTEELRQACERLTRRGHVIALDDWFEDDPRQSLLDIAAWVKIDVLDRGPEAAAALARPLLRLGKKLVAERVEDRRIHDACVAAGFQWFQGYFYRRPEIVQRPDISPAQVTIIEAMNLVRDESISAHRIAEHFKHDPTLAYKVVRMANVAPVGIRTIESVEHAVAIVGLAAIFRWLSLLLAASIERATDAKRELLREALVRARLCEIIAENGAIHSGHLFLVGLFSRIESLLEIPLGTILDRVAFPAPVTEVLEARSGPYAPLLALAEAFEDCQWERILELADLAGVPTKSLPEAQRAAFDWVVEVSRRL
jgi:EAL and modified HD-GYP domain-containing signal transduction protein